MRRVKKIFLKPFLHFLKRFPIIKNYPFLSERSERKKEIIFNDLLLKLFYITITIYMVSKFLTILRKFLTLLSTAARKFLTLS